MGKLAIGTTGGQGRDSEAGKRQAIRVHREAHNPDGDCSCGSMHITIYLDKEFDGVEFPHGLPVLWGPGQQVECSHTHLHHLIHVHSILYNM